MNYLNTDVIIDFYNSQYTVTFAKQLDTNSRTITFTPINQSGFLEAADVTTHFMLAKPDGGIVFNDAILNDNGTITVILTAQMLAVSGRALGELYLVDRINKRVLTSSRFQIMIEANSVSHAAIESTDEFNALNSLMIETENLIAECTDSIIKCNNTAEYCQNITNICADTTNSCNTAIADCTNKITEITQSGEALQQAEAARVNAENERIQAEQFRQSTFNDLNNTITNSIIPNANTAITNANNAAQEALDAAREANGIDDTAASTSKTYSSSKIETMFNSITLADTASVKDIFANVLNS